LIFIEILLDRTTGDLFQEFAAAVAKMPEILECHMVGGGFDYLIKVRVRDMAAYRSFLADTLVHMPGVRETRTYAVLDEVKNVTSLPL
jgi:Lrp/AsnC family leucine-responsive transcriptional regulator